MPSDFPPGAFFTFLTAAFSIVLGLGMVTCLNGIADTLINRHRTRVYWVQMVWVGQTLLTQVQTFWTLLQNREIVVGLSFFEYVLFWLYPLALYLLSALLFPPNDDKEAVDLHAHYYDTHRWIFGVASVPPVLFLAFHLTYLDLPLGAVQNLFPAVFSLITVTLAVTAAPRVHAALTPVLPALFVVGIALYRAQAAGTSGVLGP